GRERWSQVYRLDPFVRGEALSGAFAPVKGNGQEGTPAGFTVAGSATVPQAEAGAARAGAGIEEVPPPPIYNKGALAPWWWAGGGGVGLGAGVTAGRFRRTPPPAPPRAWALAAFARLERDGVWGEVLVERVAAIVREFIDRRFGIPAPKLTTAELL